MAHHHQAWAMLEEERADVRPNDRSPSRKRADEARKAQRESESGASTLSPMLAARVSGLLLPSAVTLLEALVASSRLEKAMEPQQGAVCQCMGQAVAQVNLVLMSGDFGGAVIFGRVCCRLLLEGERGPAGGHSGGHSSWAFWVLDPPLPPPVVVLCDVCRDCCFFGTVCTACDFVQLHRWQPPPPPPPPPRNP